MNKKITRRAFSATMLAAAAPSALVVPGMRAARAQQGYPNRPIRFVIPFAPGGVADITSRLAVEKLGEKLGQRFVVENQPGPGGIAAGRTLATSAPDGYTLGLQTNGTSISAAIYNSLPFDPVRDFTPISALGTFDLVFATNGQSPLRTFGDFLKLVREQPGKLNVGTINVGGTQNLGAELLKSSANLNFQIIPYRGTPEIIIALLRDDVQMMVDFFAPMKGALLDNKIRAVGTSGVARASYLPDIPTVNEAGVPGYEVTSWNGIFGPRGLPSSIVDLLNKAMHEVLSTPEMISRYSELGVEAKASTPDEIMGRLKNDIGKWAAVIEKAGIPKQ